LLTALFSVICFTCCIDLGLVFKCPITQSVHRLSKRLTHFGKGVFNLRRDCLMILSGNKAVAFQFLQSQTQHALGNTKVPLELIESECSVLSEGDDNKNAPSVPHARQYFIDTLAVGALRVVQHGGSLFVTRAAECAFLRQLQVPSRSSVTNVYYVPRMLTMGTQDDKQDAERPA